MQTSLTSKDNEEKSLKEEEQNEEPPITHLHGISLFGQLVGKGFPDTGGGACDHH